MSTNIFLFPIRVAMNNAVQRGVHVNPAKDLTTDYVAADRQKAHIGSSYTAPVYSAASNTLSKKWMNCGNRDASSVAERRRVAATVSSLNPSGGAVCHMSKTEQNSRRDALARVRGGGAAVPAKVRARTDTVGAPAAFFGGAHLVRSQHRLGWLEHAQEHIVHI